MVIGLILGILIGVITGTVFLLLLKTAVDLNAKGTNSILSLTTEILAIPSFWFGGHWLTGTLLKDLPKTWLSSYVISLAIIFLLMSTYPAGRWIISLGRDIGKGDS